MRGDQYIGEQVYLYEDKSGKMNLEDISKPGTPFAKSAQRVPNYGVTSSIIWVRLDMRRKSDALFRLALGFPNLDTATFYYPVGSTYFSKQSSWTFPASQRDQNAADLIFNVPSSPRDTLLRYYLKAKGRIIILPLTIAKAEEISKIQHSNALYYFFYLGFVAMLFLYNFSIYITSKEKEYFYYSTWVLFATLFFMINKGYNTYFIPEELNGVFRHTNIISSLGGLSILLFVQSTLRLKQLLPKIIKWYQFLFAGYLLIIVISLMQHFQAASNLSQIMLLLTVILGLISGTIMYRRGYDFAKYYFYGFIVTLISMFIYILIFQKIFTYNKFTNNSIVVGSVIEMVLFSFGLGAKIKTINKEKQHAQETAIQALTENKLLIDQQNQILESTVEARTHELKLEKKKADDLLLNILPGEVANELIQNGFSNAKNYADVSVMFTDFVNFTGISEKLSPQELVNELHIYFKEIDEIIEGNNLEKIKTIGDAYLAVCGLPNPCESHALNTIKTAIQIIQFVQQRKKEGGLFDIRIGINSGPVIAGIVGIKKFAYDIWGDSVNTAARMEQHGEAGKINISGSTYALVKNYFQCTYRGKVEAKNKGYIDMYFVE
ncbi:MAG: adenylate/guanylate cyclase domain-containing protein [Saprospiraceae bacterium]